MELEKLDKEPTEHVMVNTRRATVDTIVLSFPIGGVQIVLQGFMEHHFMPGKSVVLDGFYKYPDETIAEMKPEEFYAFD